MTTYRVLRTTPANQPKDTAPTCPRCHGTGVYGWGAVVNGKIANSGPCYACQGGGQYPPNQGQYYRASKRRDTAR